MDQRVFGYALGLVGAVFFSLKAVLIKLAYQSSIVAGEVTIDAATLLAIRMGAALPLYILILLLTFRQYGQENKKLPSYHQFGLAALTGLLGYYICSYIDFIGLQMITAQLERLLLFTYPAFVLLLSAIFLKKTVSLKSIAAIALGYSGIVVIFTGGDIAVGSNVPLGSALIILCAFLFAGFQLLAKHQIDLLGARFFTCAAMIGATGVIWAHFLIASTLGEGMQASLDLPLETYLLGSMIGIVSTLVPSFMINMALARIGAQTVATLGMIGPIATIYFAIALLGEGFGLIDAIGTFLTMAGIGLYSWYDRKQKIEKTNSRENTPLTSGLSSTHLPDKPPTDPNGIKP